MKKGRWLTCFVIFIFVFMMLNTLSVFAGPSRTTYQAKIIKPDGYPLESTNVNFKFTILDPAGSCILYSETFSNVNMGSSAGLVSFALGTGVRTFPVIGSNFEQVFSNTVASLICDSGGPATYSPSANDTRKIVMQFNDSTGWQTLPAMTINAVPYAMYANDSLKFNGKDITEFVQTASLPTCGASEAIRFNGAGFSCIAAGGTGTITSGSVITALGYTPVDGASITTVTSNVNSVSSTVASVSSTVYSVSSTVTSLQNSVAASFAAITSSQWSTIGADIYYTSRVGVGTSSPSTLFDVGGWPEAPAGLANGANITGNLYVGNTGSNIARTRLSSNVNGGFLQWNRLLTASGAVQTDITKPSFSFEMSGTTDRFIFQRSAASSTTLVDLMTITGSGRVGIGVSTPVTALEVSGGVRIGSENATCAPSYAGTLRYNAGVVEYCNGTSWAAFGVSGAGILAINGLVSGSQTFAFGSSGTTPNVSSVGSVHTFNFPYASVAATTAGVISYSDYLTFSNKQSATSAAIIATLGYTPADSVSLTTLSSTVGSVSAAVNSVSSMVASVSSSVNSVSNTVASLQNAMAASFGAITSSQWITSGTNIYYNMGAVGVGTVQPEGAFNIASTGAPGTLLFVDTYSGTTGINPAVIGRSSRGVAGSASATLQSDKLLFLGGRGDTGTGFSNSSPVNIIMRASENWSAVSQGTQIEFSTSANGTSASLERMKITNTGNIGIGTSNPVAKLDVSGAIRIGVDTSSCIAGLAGTIRYNAGVVEYCNGTTWVTFGAAGAGILAINGLTSGSQTFAFGSSGTAPNVSSTGTVHTFNFPYASVAATTAGVISYSDYLTFSNKQSATSAAITATLGYSPADSASVTAVSAAVASVSSTVNSVSSAVASLQNAVAASFGTITSSQWTTSGTGIFYNTGNVGIGASSPAEMLHLNAASGVIRSGFRTSWTDTNAYGEWNAYEGATFMGGISVFGSTYATSAYRNAFMMSAANNNLGSLIFRTRTGGAYQERMNILNNGYVGIGTSAPTQRFEVDGGISSMNSVDNSTSRSVRIMMMTDTVNAANAFGNGDPWLTLEGGANGGSATLQIVGNQNRTLNVRLHDGSLLVPNGNIGVGLVTSAPSARLHITAGTSSGAPVKLTLGTLLTTPQAGAIEYDGTDYYITDNSNVRRTIATASTGGVLNNTSVVSSTSGIALWPAAGNSVVVSSTVASTNSTTGALIVNGGAGIAGALNVGGIISGSAIIKGTGFRANQGAPDAADSSTVGYAFGSDGDTGIFSPGTGSANGVLAFYSNNAEKMRVTNNGLGIGTSSPSFPLDVQTAGTITQRLYHASNSQYDDANLILARSRGTISAPSAVLSGDAIGGVYFRGHDGSGMTSSSAYIAVSAEQNFTGGTKGTSMKFGTTVSGTGSYQEIMRIHSNGYVGIGNTTPNALLQVGPSGSQPANYNIYLASYRSTAGQGQLVGNWANTDYWGLGPATNSGSDNTLRLGNTSDRTGTWSATQNLNLVMGGGLAVGSGTVGTYKFIATKNFNGISSETAAFIGGTDAGSIGSGIYVMQKDNLGFNTNTSYLLNVVQNNISKFLVTGLGNVGVGTSAPAEKVHIENTTGQANLLIKGMGGATSTRAEVKLDRYDNPRGAGVRMLDSNTGGAQWWAGVPYSGGGATDLFTIGRHTTQPEYTANAMFTVTSTGNVGIGTTAPALALTVDDTAGTVSAPYIAGTDKLAVIGTGNTVIQVTAPSSNTAAIYFSDPQSRDPGGVAYSHLTDSMSFRANGATRMTIASGGAVGIGTGTPVTTLHVRSAANYGAVMLGDNGGTSNHHLTHETDGSFAIFTGTFGAGVRQFTIASGGAVGIGVTSPLTNFEVNGNISTKGGEILMQRPVTGGGWARGLHYTPDGNASVTTNGLAGIGLYGTGTTQNSIYLTFGTAPWNSATGMQILSNGNVGIGLVNPTALLHVNGAALATAWNTSSDQRLKENIKPIENPIDKILQLRGVEFDWRKDVEAPTKHDETHDIGVIAQEVEKVFPEAVTTPKTGYKSVAYSKLVAPLIEAVKSLYHRILGVEAQQVEQARTIASKADQQALDIANAKIQKLESENAAKEKELQEMKLRLEKIEKALNSK